MQFTTINLVAFGWRTCTTCTGTSSEWLYHWTLCAIALIGCMRPNIGDSFFSSSPNSIKNMISCNIYLYLRNKITLINLQRWHQPECKPFGRDAVFCVQTARVHRVIEQIESGLPFDSAHLSTAHRTRFRGAIRNETFNNFHLRAPLRRSIPVQSNAV